MHSDSLAYALQGAARAAAAVRAGTALPQALTRVFQQMQPAASSRGAIQDLAYRAMRQRGRAEALLSLLTERPPQPALLQSLLECALALLLAAPEEAPYDAHTVVNQAVFAASGEPEIARAKGMVNAVLRRFLREQAALLAKLADRPEARWNYPGWWIDAAKSAYPRDWEALLAAGNAPPPLSLRVNARRGDVDAYLRLLAEHGMGARAIGPFAVRLDQPVPVTKIPGFADGLVSVQDAAAQLAAPLLDLSDGMRVLDACAAPGGKTGHMLELAQLDLLAIDSDRQRLARIGENLDRLGLQAQLRQGDAASNDWWDGQPFDRILADVPCTASGIVRRHPDIKWLRRSSDTARLAGLSERILDNLWTMLRPGGKLLFVTCSIWPRESRQQAEAFAKRQGAIALDAPGQLLPTVQADRDHDGLFYALFQKPGL
ncbi:16S rRNA (cytosine(967)-C(5))-methyltransferase RsmB [Noviherbaspirillum pedocola]|uniref:16S rRNA (cytosine(967)-C(5))-methyltransferase n=1 Tax=Noviherbaspirillum pedocola TaxID=2801341 RepID=A0A934W6P9_9BURK|nr:16S rRNA (cytosine(967)-C(5))-methyltransferase RsmB [Noviherbaspirillum pedocola]MBK4736482.1 16S rRNA (cytosine(967)-C(5))-methyltransferase RsmB [Noviherbaspirillum pedocola]